MFRIHRSPNQIERLIETFLDAKDGFLSKEDIRQDVQYDEYSSDESIRQLIYETRKAFDGFRLLCISST